MRTRLSAGKAGFCAKRFAGRVAMTFHNMIIDHADRLHEGIDDGRATELKSGFLEVL